MPSFDIVSELDTVELKNAVDNANRELDTRFDFRGVDANFTLNKEQVALQANEEFQCRQMLDMLRNNLTKRGVDPRSMETGNVSLSGKTATLHVDFKQGIDQPTAKKIVKMIKDAKLKVQASIQGDSVRVTGKKRDDLQSTMALLKGNEDIAQPLQFNNFRD
ncbi:YajQ family cyclic di-GMP-binding protein [Paraferrimonas sedimenticola]|uniref:Nucleotide-binding protein GCM10007895_21100 n=1 Tax=Paraferrimonas sedimenticola TaxID=375674 RepID=A0AA37VYN3_9GAMM|nr:YajQ family cyclic di-GMP-binding protein [Paraferrimonas sedimenticola]GLP96804.1 UPF0234 protein [Paraferrimonas sedimenticola]